MGVVDLADIHGSGLPLNTVEGVHPSSRIAPNLPQHIDVVIREDDFSVHFLLFSEQFFCCHSLVSSHLPALFPHSIAGLPHFNAAFPHFDRVLTVFNMDFPHSDEVHPHFNRVSITFDRSPAKQRGRMIPEMRPECD